MGSKPTHSTVSSDEINFLVFRYLQESGYIHSAFTFGYESQVVKSKIDGSQIPPGALLSFVQRGVNFVEIEESLGDEASLSAGAKDGTQATSAMDGVTSLLDVHRCLCNQDFKPKAHHHQQHQQQQQQQQGAENGGAGDPNAMDVDEKEGAAAVNNNMSNNNGNVGNGNNGKSNAAVNTANSNKPSSRRNMWSNNNVPPQSSTKDGTGTGTGTVQNMNNNNTASNNANAANTPNDNNAANNPSSTPGTNNNNNNNVRSTTANNNNNNNNNNNSTNNNHAHNENTANTTNKRPSIDVADSDLLTLRGHGSEVFVCAWNPRTSVLATGSGDSTARIWPIPSVFPSPSTAAAAVVSQPLVLSHGAEKHAATLSKKANDVTTLDWNPSGTLLASGSYDGRARIWTESGELKHTLSLHKGPLFSLKWNKKGNYLLSGSVDQRTAVWNADTGKLIKDFTFHDAPTLDADWKDDDTFASCSTDRMIYMCSLTSTYPLRTYEGHEDEINCLKFDPSGNLLASCSDDYTARVWSTKTSSMLHCLREHTREVYTMQWCPNVNRRLVLATASFDALVKIWDVNTGRCLKTLSGHTDPVYSLAYSPNGQFLASGSFDRCLNIWNAKDGALVKQFRGAGGIFEVAWNPAGDKVSACFSSNTVCVIDLRKLVSTTIKL